jgi:non-specific serine/threonine protein kinase/serine/threonine-protein kinase
MKADWRRIEEVFLAALEQPAEHRAAFVKGACASDPDVRDEVLAMLRSHEQTGDFLETPAYQANAELLAEQGGSLKIGERFGDYRIISLLGEGGMGEVYLAEDLSLGRRVALKLVRTGFGGASLLRQFQREERILAGLTHPNIARLYGGAITPSGVPYFVMEYVEGERIDAYCDRRPLSLRDRLGLFRKVCSAVAYAHQHLVIHRDLKPANIRVGTDGEPKLLDFGIATLVNESAGAEQTMTLTSAMTPDYASPEQLRGEAMTTATDVYSLGVILFELLTGQKPYRTKSRRIDEIARAITEQDATKPSSALARGQKSEVRSQKLLRGDLDNIVLMAMRKEPARRYSSAAQFSEDIGRHLDGLPVAAHKDTLSYRTRKFVRRHRVGVVAASLVLLAVISGMIATLWEWRVARLERAKAEDLFKDARQLANSFMFEFHDAIQDLPGSTAARALVVKRALEYLDRLAQKSAGDPTLRRELATAYRRVGDVQGNPNNANLGDTAGAMKSYDKALAIATELAAADRADGATQRLLALIYQKLAEVQAATGDLAGGVESSRKSLGFFKQFAEAAPSDLATQQSLAVSHIKLGDVLGNSNFPNAGEPANASAEYLAASKILESLRASGATDERSRRLLGIVYERIGTMEEAEKNFEEALQTYKKSLAIREALATDFPNNTDAVRDAAIAHEKIGNAMTALGHLDAALESRRKSLDIFQSLARSDVKNVQAQRSVAISYRHLGDLLGHPELPNLGKLDEALENYRKALEIYLALDVAAPGNPGTRRDLAELYATIGGINAVLAGTTANSSERSALTKEARTNYQRSLDIWLDLQTHGHLSEGDGAQIDKVRSSLARLDSATSG